MEPVIDACRNTAEVVDAGSPCSKEQASAAEAEEEDLNTGERKSSTLWSHIMCSDWNLLNLLYLSLFSTFGVTLRAFCGRFFGGDCELNSGGQAIDDWLWPLSHTICVTANGKTNQHGGALFIDLPANMIGSFFMGLATSHSVILIPCLHRGHPLQNDKSLHLGIKTALCGSLTTFSSWNSQMVLMMDGSANPYLGSQILAAIFGYILGLQACIGSFRAGRAVAAWCHKRRNPYVFDSTMTQHELRQRCHYMHLYWMTPVAIFIIYATLLALYVLGDVYLGIPYYRQLWLACLVAPFGTILRWKLSLLNGKFNFPAGTFLANVIASILSAALSASGIVVSSNKSAIRWGMPLIKAASLGIAGSMSTVSTFVKECHELEEKNQAFDPKAFLYSYGTLIICCFGGLMVYSPIVRNAN